MSDSQTTLRAEHGPGAEGLTPFVEVKDLVVAYGARTVVEGVSFSIRQGEQLSLLGPSGCGKTTTLRCIAGLETPQSGEISIDGRTVFSSAKRINIPPEKRELSLMFQSYAIWPHMTVFDNVAYGLRTRKVPKGEIDERVQEVLDMVGMAEYARVPATQLSGGQQQRVALARSYAYPPKALLLDEPLSNLDARLRDQVRSDLHKFQRSTGVTTIYVTHDQEEAMALSDRIIIMNGGHVVQDGSPEAVYRKPATTFVADFIGAANVLTGTLSRDDGGLSLAVAPDVAVACEGTVPDSRLGTRASACVRTIFPALSRTESAQRVNSWPARIARTTMLGDFVEFVVEWPGGTMRAKALSTQILDEGERVYLTIDPHQVVLLDDTEEPRSA